MIYCVNYKLQIKLPLYENIEEFVYCGTKLAFPMLM